MHIYYQLVIAMDICHTPVMDRHTQDTTEMLTGQMDCEDAVHTRYPMQKKADKLTH